MPVSLIFSHPHRCHWWVCDQVLTIQPPNVSFCPVRFTPRSYAPSYFCSFSLQAGKPPPLTAFLDFWAPIHPTAAKKNFLVSKMFSISYVLASRHHFSISAGQNANYLPRQPGFLPRGRERHVCCCSSFPATLSLCPAPTLCPLWGMYLCVPRSLISLF